MPDSQRLTKDPVFQLNSCIWLVWRSPAAASSRTYLDAGFFLRALGRKLSMIPTMRNRYEELGWGNQPPEPDVLFQHSSSAKHLALECKATSFSTASSTAKQARKLLTLCADPNSCAGARGAIIVTYVLSAEETDLQIKTLEELSTELRQVGFDVADSGTLGLSIEDSGLWATLTLLVPGKHAELSAIEGRVRVAESMGGDSRPLYIVPYDPAAADNQHADERDYCARQLSERILLFAMEKVGRASVPDIASIDPIDAMKRATFGVSDRWLSNDVDTLRRKIEEELFRVLARGMPDKVERAGRKVHVNLVTLEDQRVALSLLQKAVPEYVANRLIDPQLPLMEED